MLVFSSCVHNFWPFYWFHTSIRHHIERDHLHLWNNIKSFGLLLITVIKWFDSWLEWSNWFILLNNWQLAWTRIKCLYLDIRDIWATWFISLLNVLAPIEMWTTLCLWWKFVFTRYSKLYSFEFTCWSASSTPKFFITKLFFLLYFLLFHLFIKRFA